MKRRMKLGMASLKVLGAFLVLGVAAHASLPYLPLIGPPPLRVEAIKSPAAVFVRFEASATTPETNSTAVNANSANSGTNSIIMAAAASPVVTDPSLGDSFTASVFPMATPDLLGITPQMLSTYFHPVMVGTNLAPLMTPYRVSFMPPLPPDNSSHAEYIVK